MIYKYLSFSSSFFPSGDQDDDGESDYDKGFVVRGAWCEEDVLEGRGYDTEQRTENVQSSIPFRPLHPHRDGSSFFLMVLQPASHQQH